MSGVEVSVRETLVGAEIAGVLALVQAAGERDGVGPLSEHAVLAVKQGGRVGARSYLVKHEEAGIVGYGYLEVPETSGQGEAAVGELVVHPEHRGRGYGRRLAGALIEEAGGPLRIWAHGDLPAAAGLAEALGMRRARALFQLHRPLAEELPEVRLAPGIDIRTFRKGEDEAAWLEVNRRAFAHHPEQGAWTLDDLLAREQEPWFDPAGFFLAVRQDGTLAGFHWTKVHNSEIGEVYVIGVDPAAQGLGLGRALTLVGLNHLRSRGLTTVMLYVDESNRSAGKLYESLGFVRFAVDVMYAD